MPATSEVLPLLFGSALKSTVILGLAAAGALWLRRGSAASRHLAWQLGLIGVLALPVVSWLMPAGTQLDVALPFASRIVAPARQTPEAPATVSTAPIDNTGTQRSERVDAATAPANLSEPASTPSAPATASESARWQRVLPWVAAVWAAGVALVLGRFGLGLLLAYWYTRRSRPLDAIEWASLNETMSFAVGLGHPVKLLQSERASTPMTFGVINPVVLLPKDANEWPEERRRIVLLHELAHVHRLDSLTHIFANLACALYWFNPLVWITAARLRAEAERACDDWVLRAGMRASTYADHLLDMVRTIGRLHTPAVALPMAQRSTFEGRLLAILEPGINRSGLTRGQSVMLTSLIAIVVLPLAALTPTRAAGNNSGDNIPIGVNLTQRDDTTKRERSSKSTQKDQESQTAQNQ